MILDIIRSDAVINSITDAVKKIECKASEESAWQIAAECEPLIKRNYILDRLEIIEMRQMM